MIEKLFKPGGAVPGTGIYRCNGECNHSYDVRGNRFPHRFPPLPDSCAGSGWLRETASHARQEAR